MFRLHAIAEGDGYGLYLRQDAADEAYWMGRGAELLGLQGPVSIRDFDQARLGFDPTTGESLRTKERHDMVRASDGQVLAQQRRLYDMVLMAPKTVSVMTMVDPRLIEAHRAAVAYTQRRIEELAMTRVRKNHACDDRLTRNVVMAGFEHRTSRALDPQIHTHLATVNMTYDPVERRWKALQAVEIYRHVNETTEDYRRTLAQRVEPLGYSIVDRQDRSVGWEIGGVPQSIAEKFSQRSAERDRQIEAFRESHGRNPGGGEVTTLVRANRPDKNIQPPYVVREMQLARLSPTEHRELIALKQQSLERQVVYEIHEPRYRAEPYRMEPQGQLGVPRPHPGTPEPLKKETNLRDKIDSEPELFWRQWEYGDLHGETYQVAHRSRRQKMGHQAG